MTTEIEKRWEWDVVEPGPSSEPVTSEVTADSVAAYARRVRNFNPAYAECRLGDLAMPTEIFSDAPLLRNAVAKASGFVALEWVKENPRQTAFAQCTVHWFAPVRVGDTVTSSARVVEKYERRGNKFVTFRVEALNQHGVKVAEYDYSCIFEYAKGQKSSSTSGTSSLPTEEIEMAGVNDKITFASLKLGDAIPAFEIGETQESIDGARNPDRVDDSPPKNIHNDPDFAKEGLFGGTVNAGVSTMAYVNQVLEQWFPAEAFYNGGSLTYKGVGPFRPGDTVVFTGKVTGKRVEDGKQYVDLEIVGTDQTGRLVGVADATVVPDA